MKKTTTQIDITITKEIQVEKEYRFLATQVLFICDWMENDDIKLVYSVLSAEEKAEIKRIMWELKFDEQDKEQNRKDFLNIAIILDLEVLKNQKQNITNQNKNAYRNKKKSSKRKAFIATH